MKKAMPHPKTPLQRKGSPKTKPELITCRKQAHNSGFKVFAPYIPSPLERVRERLLPIYCAHCAIGITGAFDKA